MSGLPELSEAMRSAELIHDRAAIEAAIARMAGEIAADYRDGGAAPDAVSRPLFVTVMHGGLPFAAQLALEIGAHGLDLEFEYLHATRYRGAQSGGELAWKHRPETDLRGFRSWSPSSSHSSSIRSESP